MKSLVKWASDVGHEVHLLCDPQLEGLDELSPRATIWPRKMTRRPAFRDVLDAAYVARLIRREDFDLIHAHSSKTGALTRIARRLAGTRAPVLYSPHGYAFRNEGLSRPARLIFGVLERMLGRWTDAVVALSTEEQLDAKRIAPSARVFRARNGARPLPQQRSPESKSFVIAFVGRLVRTKGVDVLLSALPGVLAAEPNAEAWIIGDGEERADLEDRAQALHLKERVRFLGLRTDLSDLWPSIDVLVMPSRHDVQPFVLLEGMAAGRAIVATRVGGIPDVVCDGVNGVLVAPEQPGELAAAILSIVRRPSHRRNIMANAMRSAPTEAVMFADHHSIYEDLIGA